MWNDFTEQLKSKNVHKKMQTVCLFQLNVTHFMTDIMNQTFDQSYEVVVITKDYFPRLQKILSETDPQ